MHEGMCNAISNPEAADAEYYEQEFVKLKEEMFELFGKMKLLIEEQEKRMVK